MRFVYSVIATLSCIMNKDKGNYKFIYVRECLRNLMYMKNMIFLIASNELETFVPKIFGQSTEIELDYAKQNSIVLIHLRSERTKNAWKLSLWIS